MKKYTLFTIVILLITLLTVSCATTGEPEIAAAEPDKVVIEPVAEVEVIEAEVVAEVKVEPVAEVEVIEAEVVAEAAEAKPVEIWQALNIELTENSNPIYIPEEFLSYPVFIGVFEHEYIELKVWGTGFKIAAIYEIGEEEIVVTPVYYENVPNELRDVFIGLNIDLPVNYYFTAKLNNNGTAVLKAEGLGYELIVPWFQVM